MTSHRRISVIAGDPRGIGRAIATRLAPTSDVYLVEHADGANTSTPAASVPQNVRTSRIDFADDAALRAMIDRVAADHGHIDVLINLPIAAPGAGVMDVEPAEWDQVFALNSHRVFHLMQQTACVMRDHGGGRVVNVVTSEAKGWWGTQAPALAATLSAITALGRIAALQLSIDQINVNTVCVGLMVGKKVGSTETFAGTPVRLPAYMNETKPQRVIPLDRPNGEDDVVAAVEFLVSPGARNITGQSLNVDGGLIFD